MTTKLVMVVMMMMMVAMVIMVHVSHYLKGRSVKQSSHLHFHKNELQNAWVFSKSCKQDG